MLSLEKGVPDGSVDKELTANSRMQEAWIPSLGREDLLEEEVTMHSGILA